MAMVIQQLADLNLLSTLLMRTVLQALKSYPPLIGFVMNILQRLIMKQVWKQPKVWEEFIKWCQKTKPQSFQVLLQLPGHQLKQVFDLSPDLKEPLLNYITALSRQQQAHIPQGILKVLQCEESVDTHDHQREEYLEDAEKIAEKEAPIEMITALNLNELNSGMS